MFHFSEQNLFGRYVCPKKHRAIESDHEFQKKNRRGFIKDSDVVEKIKKNKNTADKSLMPFAIKNLIYQKKLLRHFLK